MSSSMMPFRCAPDPRAASSWWRVLAGKWGQNDVDFEPKSLENHVFDGKHARSDWFSYCRVFCRTHRVVGHLARAESGYQRPLSWDATLTVPGRAPQQAAARRTPSSARREARDADVDILLHRAREADQGERLRRADRAVEAVGALLQPAEGRVQREPQRTGGRGAWRGRVFEPRASARHSACRGCTQGCGDTCAPRAASREAATRCPGSCRTARHSRMVMAGDFSSRAVEPERPPRRRLARRCPGHPRTRPRRRERPASPLSV